MKKLIIRFMFTLVIVACIATSYLSIPIFAAGNITIIDSLPNFDENYIPLSMINYSIDDKMNEYGLQECENIVDIIVSNENVKIKANMYSEYVDVFGKLQNEKYINITDNVICEFDDESIAEWIFGRILAKKEGVTNATLKYNGLIKEITITVENQIISADNMIGNVSFDKNGNECTFI